MAIKLADTLAPMADFPAAMAEHIAFADGKTLQEKVDNGDFAGSGEGSSVVVDTAVSDTSENPVQNKVIKKYVDNTVSEITAGDIVVQGFENYSAEEIVIGRWVDGRPVYRLYADTITTPEVKSPIMTSATDPAPCKVTSSSVYSGYSDWKAFGDINTFGNTYDVWCSSAVPTASNPQWLQIDMGESITFNQILMSPRSYNSGAGDGINHIPADFTISGSIDGTNFETLLNVTGAVWDDISVKSFEFEKTGQYRYYRLTVTDTKTHQSAIVGRIQYYYPSETNIDNLDVIINQTIVEETGYIIVEYIKTTDAPDSFKPEILPSLSLSTKNTVLFEGNSTSVQLDKSVIEYDYLKLCISIGGNSDVGTEGVLNVEIPIKYGINKEISSCGARSDVPTYIFRVICTVTSDYVCKLKAIGYVNDSIYSDLLDQPGYAIISIVGIKI